LRDFVDLEPTTTAVNSFCYTKAWETTSRKFLQSRLVDFFRLSMACSFLRLNLCASAGDGLALNWLARNGCGLQV